MQLNFHGFLFLHLWYDWRKSKERWKWQKLKEIQKKLLWLKLSLTLISLNPQKKWMMRSKTCLAPCLKQCSKENWIIILAMNQMINRRKKMIIDVTVMVRSRSRRLRAISRSMSPETVTVLLNLNSFQNEKKMFLQSKIRFWLCMRAACRKEISPRRSRISMASACHMRWSRISLTRSFLSLKNGA